MCGFFSPKDCQSGVDVTIWSRFLEDVQRCFTKNGQFFSETTCGNQVRSDIENDAYRIQIILEHSSHTGLLNKYWMDRVMTIGVMNIRDLIS